MKTRHALSRENKKNQSTPKPADKEKNVKNQKVAKSKKQIQIANEVQEPIYEPLDIQATFDFNFPPEVPENINFPNTSKSGVFLNQLQKDLINEILQKYLSDNSLVFIDETGWLKFPIVCSFMQCSKMNFPNLPPFLIITSNQVQNKWLKFLSDFAPSLSVFTFQTDKKSSNHPNINYPISSPVKFDVLIILREQFIKDGSKLPQVMWNSVIFDDLSIAKSPLSSLIPQFSKIQYHHAIVLTADFNSMSITDLSSVQQILKCEGLPQDEPPTIESFQTIIKPYVIGVSTKDVADSFTLYENLLLCPMTQHQLKIYNQVFLKCKNEMTIDEMIQIAQELKQGSTHPFLIKSLKDQTSEDAISGKFVVLGKLLAQQKTENRKVIIVCSSMDEIAIVHTFLLDHQIQHLKIDTSARVKQMTKFIQRFNSSPSFSVIIITCASMDSVLPHMNADTIVAFDIDWTPLSNPIGITAWIGRAKGNDPKIYQLITKLSYEQLLFEFVFRNKEITVQSFNEPETADQNILDLLIKNSAKLSRNGIDPARGTSWASVAIKESPIICFSDDSLFKNELEDITEDLFAQKMEEKPKVKLTPSKPLPSSQFWTVDRLTEIASILNAQGLGQLDLSEHFGRPQSEVPKVIAMFLRFILPEYIKKKIEERNKKANKSEEIPTSILDEYIPSFDYENVRKFLSKFSQSDFHRFGLPSLPETVFHKINPAMLLLDIEVIENLKKIVPENLLTEEHPTDLSSIIIEGNKLEPLGDDWTKQQDLELLYLARKHGLKSIPDDFYPQYKDSLIDRIRKIILENIRYEKDLLAQPTIIRLRKPRIFGLDDHKKIVNTLMEYGYTNPIDFMRNIELKKPYPESVDRYVHNILKYCTTTGDERKAVLPLLAEKIQKYNTAKIPQRVQLFEQIRDSINKYHDFPAEDIEFLTAISFHGFANYIISPILNVNCFGHCSEIKLFTRIRTIFSEKRRNRVHQPIPKDIASLLPLKINDMQVLTGIGEITGYHTADFIFPVNYQCATITYSPIYPEILIWILCTIQEKEVEYIDEADNTQKTKKIPWFVIEPRTGKDFKFEEATPEAVFELYRSKMIKRLGRFVPPLDAYEMFGLHAALIHRLFLEMPGIEKCENYNKRYFRTTFPLVSKWPIIGQFEKEPEKSQIPQQVAQISSKFKFKRKMFGEVVQPLVFSFAPLFSQDESGLALDLRFPNMNAADLLDDYALLMKTNEEKSHDE